MAWTTARKEAARDNAEQWGDLQRFVVGSPLFPFLVVVVAVLILGLVVGTIEHTF